MHVYTNARTQAFRQWSVQLERSRPVLVFSPSNQPISQDPYRCYLSILALGSFIAFSTILLRLFSYRSIRLEVICVPGSSWVFLFVVRCGACISVYQNSHWLCSCGQDFDPNRISPLLRSVSRDWLLLPMKFSGYFSIWSEGHLHKMNWSSELDLIQ